MRISRLFSTLPIERDGTLPGLHTLESQSAHYLLNVLRHKAGDQVIIFDGHGGEFLARIRTLNRKTAEVELLKFDADNRASTKNIHMAFAALRGDRMDYALQKCCELGVSEVTPLLSQRSEFKLSKDKVAKRLQHWQGVVQSACEQSGLNQVPHIHSPSKLADWLPGLSVGSNKLLLHPDGEQLTAESLLSDKRSNDWIVASGPEGGFDDKECSDFMASGFVPCRFGPRILRAETAPVALLSVLQFSIGDLAAR
ncbi:MAG: 16S rRNA (uracil(1498)-N(3))-methyltransferase [Pseudomonadales bacterium]